MSSTSVIYNIVGRDNASRTFDKVGRSADTMQKKVGLGGKVVKAAGTAAAGGLLALGAAAAKGVTAYASFDATLRQVGIQTGASTKGLEKLALQLGQDTVFSAQDAADAMLELSKSGLTSAEIQGGALASTLKLAAAGGTDLADAATYMADSMHAFGLKTKDTNKIVTALAGAANASSIDVSDLGFGLSQVASSARNSGLTLNDTVAVLADLGNAGIKGSDAGTSLKTMLQRLVPQTDKAKSAMKDLGLKFTDAHGNFKSITDIAQQLHDKLGKLSQAQQAQALQTIFGSDATRAATVLMRSGAKGLETYEKATRNSSVANKLAKSRMQGLSGAIENLKGSAETTAIRLGKALSPAVEAIAKIIANDVLPRLGDFVDFLTTHLAGPAAAAKKAVSGIFTDLKPVVVTAGQTVSSFFNGVIHSKLANSAKSKIAGIFGGIEPAIATSGKNVADFLAGLSGKHLKPKNATTVQQIVDVQTGVDPTAAAKAGKKIHDTLHGLFSGKVTLDPDKLGKSLGNALVTAFQGITKYTKKIGQFVVDLFAGLPWIEIGKKAAFAAVPFVVAFTNNIIESILSFTIHHPLDLIQFALALIPIGKGAGLLLKGLEKALPESKLIVGLARLVLSPLEKTGALIERALGKVFSKVGGAIWSGIKKGFGDELGGAASFIGRLAERGIGKSINRVIDPIRLKAGEIGAGILHGIEQGTRGLTRLTLKLIKLILSPFRGAGSWLIGRGRSLMSGLLSGIGRGWTGVSRWLAKVGGRILKFFRGIGAWLIVRGRDLLGGLLSGIGRGWSSVARWLGRTSARILSPFRGASQWLISHGRDIFGGLFSGMTRKWSGVWRWFKGVPGKFGRAALGWATTLINKGGALIQGLFDGITGKLGSAKEWVRKHIFNPIKDAVVSLFKIHSPSRVMHELGGHVMNGFIKGMLLHDPVALAKNLVGSIPKVLESIVQQGFMKVSQLSKKGIKTLQSVGFDPTSSGLGAAAAKLWADKTIGGSGSPGAAAWAPQILEALGLLGQSSRWLPIVEHRLNQESGGNPTIVNTWDSNWLAGHPSVGLMQVIRGTFQKYAGIFRNRGPYEYGVSVNPLANIYAGLNYAINRYGTLSALMRPGGYDHGGLLMPGGIGVNLTNKPEMVRSANQEDQLRSELAEIKKLLAQYLDAERVTNVNLDGKPFARAVTKQQKKDMNRRRIFND